MSSEITIINLGNGFIGATYCDPDPENPRQHGCYDSSLRCWHRRYRLGDKLDGFQTEYDGPEFFKDLLCNLCKLGYVNHVSDFDVLYPEDHEWAGDVDYEATNEKIEAFVRKHYVMLPVYLYDHSGLSMNTGGFGCPWDSGQVGWIYEFLDPEEGAEVQPCGKTLREIYAERLSSEVETYSSYLEGDVYGYKVFDTGDTFAHLPIGEISSKKLGHVDLEDFEEVDASWNIYGEDVALDYMEHFKKTLYYVKRTDFAV